MAHSHHILSHGAQSITTRPATLGRFKNEKRNVQLFSLAQHADPRRFSGGVEWGVVGSVLNWFQFGRVALLL